MVYIDRIKLFKKMNMNNGIEIQTAMSRLFVDIVKSDLRAMQMKIRKSEYNILINICVEAEQYGLDTSKLRQASNDMAGEVTPYTEKQASNAPSIMLSMISGLQQIINGYGSREPERVAGLKTVVQNCERQKNYMFHAIQQGVNAEKILFMTESFIKRYKGCQEYNRQMIDKIVNMFEANDNAHVLKSVTAYLVLLEFAAPYASYIEDDVILFAYRQRLKGLTDAAGGIKVIFLDFEQKGLYYDAVEDSNKDSYVQQGNQLDSLKSIHARATFGYIADILRASEPNVQRFYMENASKDNKTLMQDVALNLRKGFYNNLFGSIQNAFLKLVTENRNLVASLTKNGTEKNYIRESPINLLLEHIAHNPISSTKHARETNRDFETTLKRVLRSDKKLEDMMTTPRFKAYHETVAMEPANRAAEALTTTMNMDIDEAADEFGGMRDETAYNITIYGNYILTRTDYRQYPVRFPVIQIKELMTGSMIVGVNDAAQKLGFGENLFITEVKQDDNEEIEKFMQDAGRGAAGERMRVTRFTLVQLGRRKQNVEERDEQLLDEALGDTVPVLDDTFWDTIK